MLAAPKFPRETQADPLLVSLLITAAFIAFALVSLTTIAMPVFDEVHYLPAARAWLEGERLLNPEHPLLGKQLMAIAIGLFGDTPFGWRIGSVLFSALALLATMRATWLASASRFAALASGFFLVTSFTFVVQARSAMLDAYMLGFAMLAVWAGIAALHGRNPRARLALAGILFGLALASKWTVAPLIGFAAPAFLVAQRWSGRADTIAWYEVVFWLWAVPAGVYLAHFLTIGALAAPPANWSDPLSWQFAMYALQSGLKEGHTYQSNWWHWIANWRPVWYFYEEYAGSWRGILYLGNPVTMLAALPALAYASWHGWRHRDGALLAAAAAWLATLALWIVAPKPTQFYYHYLLPTVFAMIALALVTDRCLWRGRDRGWVVLLFAATGAVTAYFLPVLLGTPLAGQMSFADYTWLDSWR